MKFISDTSIAISANMTKVTFIKLNAPADLKNITENMKELTSNEVVKSDWFFVKLQFPTIQIQ